MVSAARERDLVAARLLGASEAVGEATGYSLQAAERDVHEHAVPDARARAGAEPFGRAWAEGRMLTREQAFASPLRARPRPRSAARRPGRRRSRSLPARARRRCGGARGSSS